jgi:hypothetical protein
LAKKTLKIWENDLYTFHLLRRKRRFILRLKIFKWNGKRRGYNNIVEGGNPTTNLISKSLEA